MEGSTSHPDFWQKAEEAQAVMQKIGRLQHDLADIYSVQGALEEMEVLLQLVEEAENEKEKNTLLEETEALQERLAKELAQKEVNLLFQGRYDERNAILAIHPGAGGLDAQDWAEMLLRMYSRWAEKKGYKTEVLDLLPGDEAGIKSVTITVQGYKAYGYLQAERGVHRLVRISPFDTGGRRHTSFASVDVLPEIEENNDIIQVNADDLRVDTFRAQGAGGQHVNKTDSAVRITHLPTGIVVSCQNERSQHSNRERAMRILLAKLADMAQREQEEQLKELRGEQREIAWGSQIRSYTFHPYSLVKDHRTSIEEGNVQGVMDGDIDSFLEAFLRQKSIKHTRK